ncbi:ArsC/Spx/MgsR family protein [Candidatus Halocynthiibacter alkanivorans]|uniref:ArsC/Spx/MgsR family protein n=1 Tax=Candidatus Halocynthiibacter alkanivorans TaxID=2267619 RepID=UPI000DF27F40|nr:ArsC/Spx/MgsR family protein [Candidatus Halocynthiibacter alkanivorans]
MKIYGLKNCDTCRKAVKALTAELQDVRESPVSSEQLREFFTTFGDALVNTRSTTWRGLDAVERARPPLQLLADYPTLMKRPVIEENGNLHLGWGKDVQAKLLG